MYLERQGTVEGKKIVLQYSQLIVQWGHFRQACKSFTYLLRDYSATLTFGSLATKNLGLVKIQNKRYLIQFIDLFNSIYRLPRVHFCSAEVR